MPVADGTYRGIVIDTIDPAGLNRIRVQVPQVLGAATSGWAYPAWSIHDMSIMPDDRFPKAGDGVWIRFEGNDRMNWIGTFGIAEQKEYGPEVYIATIDWTLPWMDINSEEEISGTLTSPSGTPNPDPVIELWEGTKSGQVYTWTKVSDTDDPGNTSVIIDPSDPTQDGRWLIKFARTLGGTPPLGQPASTYYKVVFPGTGGFPAIESDIRQTVRPTNGVELVWSTGDPAWKTVKQLAGTVSSLVGLPVPCLVEMQHRRRDGSSWATAVSTTNTQTGNWAVNYERTEPAEMEMRAVFIGHSGWIGDASVTKQYPAITSTPTITWDMPSKTILVGVALSITGTLTSATYGVPDTKTLQFQAYVSNTWVTKSSPVANTSGQFTFSYTPDATATKYRMYYPGGGIWTSATSSEASQTATYNTTTSISSFPASLTTGVAWSCSGSVTATGVTINRGSVKLQYAKTAGGDQGWHDYASAIVSASGTWSISAQSSTYVGGVNWRVVYLGDGGSFNTSTSSTRSATLGLAAVAGLTKGAVSISTATISWTAVSGATKYHVYRSTGTAAPTLLTTITATSYQSTGLAANTIYNFEVKAGAVDAASAEQYGPGSGQVKMNTGKTAVTTAGSFSNHAVAAKDSDSWRPDVEWGYLGADVAQGYWSSSGSRYTGVISYDTATFKSWVISTYSQAVWDNMNVTSGKITMKRHTSGGDNAANKIYWYHVNVTPGSSTTIDLYNLEETTGAAWGDTVTCTLPNSWIETLLRGSASGTITSVKALAIYKNAAGAAYQQYKGYTTSGACDMTVSASWSFTSAAAVAAYWY